MSQLGRYSLAVELDSQIYFVLLPQERMELLLKMAEALFDGGKLVVVKAPADYQFTVIKESK